MKKILTLALSLALAVTAAGCSSKEEAKKTEETKQYTVGVCQFVQHPALDSATEGFKDALIDKLGADGVVFDEQNASGDSVNCSTIINSFVSKNVDLIMANATPALQAAAAGTTTIPILGTSVTEYGVALELSDFNGTVGGNISGTSDLAPLDQQAQLILDLFPETKTVGLLYCSAEPNSAYQVKIVKEELEKKGVKSTEYAFSDANDIAAVCTAACAASDVIYVPTDNSAASSAGIIDGICRPAKVPVIAGEEGICKGCGVASLTISYYDLGYKTGEMAAEILAEGKDISTMPIAYAPEITKKYNAEICAELGVKVPEDFVAVE